MAGGARDQPSVFISYARRSASEFASTLYQALMRAGIPAFLDVQDLGVGERAPQGIPEGLLGARVVVMFADPTYFTRRYCVEELAAAVAAYRALGRQGAGPEQLAEAVLPVVVALPAGGGQPAELERLPPEVATTNWPPASETSQLADLVRVPLARIEETIGQRLERLGELAELREHLYTSIAIPQPRLLGGLRVYHEAGLPPSIGDAFVGRGRELWELHTALAAPGGVAALTTALEGGGGFGKTRLALEYLHRYGPEFYPAGLLWLNAEVPEDRLEALPPHLGEGPSLPARLRLDVPAQHSGVHRAGADGVDPDAIGRHLPRQRLHEGDDRSLGGAVEGGSGWPGDPTGDAGCVSICTRPALWYYSGLRRPLAGKRYQSKPSSTCQAPRPARGGRCQNIILCVVYRLSSRTESLRGAATAVSFSGRQSARKDTDLRGTGDKELPKHR